MKGRLIAAVLAGLFALAGGVLLLGYVTRADERAMAGMAATTVLVVTKAVPEGATAEDLAASVVAKNLPALAVAPGSVTSVEQLEGMVTTTALQPGEQLLTSRLADPAALEAARGVVVPPGLQQLSVQLDRQRVIGGRLSEGATVGVFLSYKDDKVNFTQLALQKVLVTAVQGGAPAAAAGDDAAAEPSDTVTVTLALNARDAQKVVFTAEHGTIWLSAEPADAPTSRGPVMTQENLYS